MEDYFQNKFSPFNSISAQITFNVLTSIAIPTNLLLFVMLP